MSQEIIVSKSDIAPASKPTLLQLFRDRRGAGMTEYIILVGVIAMLAIVAFRFFGSSVSSKIEKQSATVKDINTNGTAAE